MYGFLPSFSVSGSTWASRQWTGGALLGIGGTVPGDTFMSDFILCQRARVSRRCTPGRRCRHQAGECWSRLPGGVVRRGRACSSGKVQPPARGAASKRSQKLVLEQLP